jgi:hypothetical protein
LKPRANPPSFTPPNFAPPVNVAAGGATTIPVLFKPSATGPRSATLLITDNAGDSPQPVPLSGNGTPAPSPANTAPAGISVSPAALDFQNQTVGVPSTPLQVTVSNGNNFSVGISPSMGGVNSREFAIVSSRIFSIAAGGTANVSMVFTPQAGGPRSALLIVNDDSGGPSHYVTLAGTGGTSAPAVQFTPLALTFPDQPVGATGTPQSVTVTNTGNATLQISGVAFGGMNSGDFAFPASFAAPAVPINLAPNASTTIPVLFKPNATGLRSATLLIADNASGSPHSATLSGNCIAPPPTSTAPPGISVGPASLSFPSQMVGTTSSPLQVTVSNGTSASVEFSPSMAGVNSADFAITSPRIFTVPAGGAANINMAFTPQAAGPRSAVLIVNNNTGTPSSFITLAGVGIASTPATQLTPLTLAFASQVVGTISPSQSLTINNTGSATLQITALAFTGTNAADFSFPFTVTLPSATAPLNVAAKSAITIPVLFRPSATGIRSATLLITSNSPTSPNAVPLAGTGIVTTLAFVPPHTATLSWQASTSAVKGYYVYRSTINGSAYSRLNSTATNSYLDSTVLAGQTYYYVVTSVDLRGIESGFSTSVSAVIPSP